MIGKGINHIIIQIQILFGVKEYMGNYMKER